MTAWVAVHNRAIVGIGIAVEGNRTERSSEERILRDKAASRGIIISHPEILETGVEIVVLAVVGIAVEVVDVNGHRGVDVGDVAEWVIGVPQEHGAVLSGGLGHIAGAVVEREYSFASSMYLKESRYKLSRCCVLRQDKNVAAFWCLCNVTHRAKYYNTSLCETTANPRRHR